MDSRTLAKLTPLLQFSLSDTSSVDVREEKCVCVCVFVCVCVCVCMCVCVCTFMHACMSVCVCVGGYQILYS